MKCSSSMLRLFLKLMIFCVICIKWGAGSKNKRIKGMMMDFDYLVSQLYLQQCTFVEIGEGVCSMFVELPVDTNKDCKRSVTKPMYFGNCLCSEFRKWQLCSRQLALQRPEDCVFEEGVSCPSSSARVHRRLCDVTGMSQWNPQCNCSTPLAGSNQEPLCGFRTCYAVPMPESICTPRTVCGTAHCDISLHGSLYGIKCDRKCKDHQPFCESVGPPTTAKRSVTSEWSHWQSVSSEEKSNIQQYEAECFDSDHKPSFDCLGPGLFCCIQDEGDCICEVKQEDGRLKAFRYSITFSRSSDSDHSALKVRSAGMKSQATVWQRLFDMADKDFGSSNDSGSLFNIHKKIKVIPNGDSKQISIIGISSLVNNNQVDETPTNNIINGTKSTSTNVTNEIGNILGEDTNNNTSKKITPIISDVIFAVNASKSNPTKDLKNLVEKSKQNEKLDEKSDYHFTETPTKVENSNSTKSNESVQINSMELIKTEENKEKDQIKQNDKQITNTTAIGNMKSQNSDEIHEEKNQLNVDNKHKTDNKGSLKPIKDRIAQENNHQQIKDNNTQSRSEEFKRLETSRHEEFIAEGANQTKTVKNNTYDGSDNQKETNKNNPSHENTKTKTNTKKLSDHVSLQINNKACDSKQLPQVLNKNTNITKESEKRIETQNINNLSNQTSDKSVQISENNPDKSKNLEQSVISTMTTNAVVINERKVKQGGEVILNDQPDPIHLNLKEESKDDSNKKTQNQLYDEPEPVLKDLDKNSIDANVADSLNKVVGLKTAPNKIKWTDKTEKAKKSQIKGNLINEKKAKDKAD